MKISKDLFSVALIIVLILDVVEPVVHLLRQVYITLGSLFSPSLLGLHPSLLKCLCNDYVDPNSEQRATESIYVPRDEAFSDIKSKAFNANQLSAALQTLIPRLQVHFDPNAGFPNFKAIDALFDVDGFNLSPPDSSISSFKDLLPWIFKLIYETGEFLFRFKPPVPMDSEHLISHSPPSTSLTLMPLYLNFLIIIILNK